MNDNKTIIISIDVKPQSKLHATFQNWGLRDKKRIFHVSELTLGNLVRISELMTGIDASIEKLVIEVNESFDKYIPIICQVVAVGLHNKKAKPPKRLRNFLLHNLTGAELLEVFRVVLKQSNVIGFIKTILLTKGVNVFADEANDLLSDLSQLNQVSQA